MGGWILLTIAVVAVCVVLTVHCISRIQENARATAEAKRKDLINAAIEKAVKAERRKAEDACRAYNKKCEDLEAQKSRLDKKEQELEQKLQETGADKEQRIKELEEANAKLQSKNETLQRQVEGLSHIQFDDFPVSVPKTHTPPPPQGANATDQVKIDQICQEAYNEGVSEGKRVAESEALTKLRQENAALLQQVEIAWQTGYNEGIRATTDQVREAENLMTQSKTIEQQALAFEQQKRQELNQVQQSYEDELAKCRDLSDPFMKEFLSSPFLKGTQKKRYLEAFADARGLKALLQDMEFIYPDAFPCTVHSRQSKQTYHTSLTACSCDAHQKPHDKPICKHMLALAIRLHAVPFDKNTFTQGITKEVAKKLRKELEQYENRAKKQ